MSPDSELWHGLSAVHGDTCITCCTRYQDKIIPVIPLSTTTSLQLLIDILHYQG